MIKFTIDKNKIVDAKDALIKWYSQYLNRHRDKDGKIPRTKLSLSIITGPYETFKHFGWNVVRSNGDIICQFEPNKKDSSWDDIHNMLQTIRTCMIEYKEQQ